MDPLGIFDDILEFSMGYVDLFITGFDELDGSQLPDTEEQFRGEDPQGMHLPVFFCCSMT
jgi:hypothetical protein